MSRTVRLNEKKNNPGFPEDESLYHDDPEDTWENVVKLTGEIQKNPKKISQILAEQNENIIEQVLQKLFDDAGPAPRDKKNIAVTEQIVYYVLENPELKKSVYFLTIYFYETSHIRLTFDQKRVAQCIQSNKVALEVIKQLLHQNEDKCDAYDLLSVKSRIASFPGPMVHEPDVFEYLAEVLHKKSYASLHLLHQALINELLFNSGENNSSSKLTSSQCTEILHCLEVLYYQTDNEYTAHAITRSIFYCDNKNAYSWLKQALEKSTQRCHTKREKPELEFTEEIYTAMANMGEKGQTDLMDLLFTDHRMNRSLAKEIEGFFNDDWHNWLLIKIEEEQDFGAAAKYMFILVSFVENDFYIFELAYLVFRILKNKSKREQEALFSRDDEDEIVRRIKHALMAGAAAGVKSGKVSGIQDMFNTAQSLTSKEMLAYNDYNDYEPELDDLFFSYISKECHYLESVLEKLMQGTFSKKVSAKKKAAPKQGEYPDQPVPFKKINDKTLAVENEFVIKARIWQNPGTSEILYIDNSYQLHYFDGIIICDPAFKIVNLMYRKESFFSQGDIRMDTAMYVKPGKSLAEFIRFGEKKIVLYLSEFEDSYRNIYRLGEDVLGFYLAWGFEFKHAGEAEKFMQAAHEAFPLDYPVTSPWFAPEYGIISRIFKTKKHHRQINPFDDQGDYPGPFYEPPSETQIEAYNKKEIALLLNGYKLNAYRFLDIYPKGRTSLYNYFFKAGSTGNRKSWKNVMDFIEYISEGYKYIKKIKQSNLLSIPIDAVLEMHVSEKRNLKIDERLADIAREVKDFWSIYNAVLFNLNDDFQFEFYSPQAVMDNYETDLKKMYQYFGKHLSEKQEKDAIAKFKGAVPIARLHVKKSKLIFSYMPEVKKFGCVPTHPRPHGYEYSTDFESLTAMFGDITNTLLILIRDYYFMFKQFRLGDRVCKNSEKKWLRYSDEKSNNFYDIAMDFDNLSLFTCYGKSGTLGKLYRADFETENNLKKAYQKKIDQQLKKGFQ